MNQAAVSRLERGNGLVPLSLVVRLGRAIGGNLIDRTLLSDAGERLLAALETLAPRGAEPWLPMTRDPGIRNLIHCYLRAGQAQRRALLAFGRALGGLPAK